MTRFASAAATVVNATPTPFKQNAAVEGVKLIDENLGNSLAAVFELMEVEGADLLDNPMFTDNGHDGPSLRTRQYFRAKKLMQVTSIIATNLLDVGGVVSAGQAGSYGLVWYRLNALFKQLIPPSRQAKKAEYAAWYSWTVEKKAVPMGSLEALMIAAMRQKMYGVASSSTKAGITFGTGGFTGFIVNSTASMIGPKLDQYLGQDVQTLAKGIHWKAFCEQVVGRGTGKGPARRILDVIWSDMSLGRASAVSLDDIIKEPQGWLVIADMMS